MQKRAHNPKFLALPALPVGYGYVMPYSNGIDVNRVIVAALDGSRKLSIYYDITCALGCMYDADGVPEAYVELYDGDYAPADYEPIRILVADGVEFFHKTILDWCGYANA